MADAPKTAAFNPEDPAQRAAANAANQQKTLEQFEKSAVTTAPVVTKADVGTKGSIIGGYFNEMAAGVTTFAKTVKDAVLNPMDTLNAVRNEINEAIDGAAIKPYEGATSVERAKAQNPKLEM